MALGIFPGNHISWQQGIKRYETPLGTYVVALGVVDITTTVATVFDVKFRSGQKDRADSTGLVIPIGAVLHRIALRVPAAVGAEPAIVATTGDRLKLATAVTAVTGSAAFAVDGTNTCVATAVAASSTFAAQAVKFEVNPFTTATCPALTSEITLKVYNDNGSTGAGSGVSVASGTRPIIVEARWWESADVPTREQAFAAPATV